MPIDAIAEVTNSSLTTAYVSRASAAAETITLLAAPAAGIRWIITDFRVITTGRGCRFEESVGGANIWPDTAADTVFTATGVAFHPRQPFAISAAEGFNMVTDATAGTVFVYLQAYQV